MDDDEGPIVKIWNEEKLLFYEDYANTNDGRVIKGNLENRSK